MRTIQEKEITRLRLKVDSAETMAKLCQSMVNSKLVINHGHREEFTQDYLELSGILELLDACKTMLRFAEKSPDLVPDFDDFFAQASQSIAQVFLIAERFNALAAAQIKSA